MSIRAEHLTHIYNPGTAMETYALKDISFEINKGEFVGVIGHTGSGKSTLMEHLNGLLKPSSGTVYLNGEDIFKAGYKLKELRSKVGLVFQYPEYQLFEEDVIKDVMFGPLNMGLTREKAREKALMALIQVGLSDNFYERSPFELSGGQKRRVAIAGVIAMEPEVLILDEPTAGLDPEGRDEIFTLIEDLRRKNNMTIILVSHSMEDVAEFADKIMVLNKGELKFFDTPGEVFKHRDELYSFGLSVPILRELAAKIKASGLDINEEVSTLDEIRAELIAKLVRKDKAK